MNIYAIHMRTMINKRLLKNKTKKSGNETVSCGTFANHLNAYGCELLGLASKLSLDMWMTAGCACLWDFLSLR